MSEIGENRTLDGCKFTNLPHVSSGRAVAKFTKLTLRSYREFRCAGGFLGVGFAVSERWRFGGALVEVSTGAGL